jgi:hypothetical protein
MMEFNVVNTKYGKIIHFTNIIDDKTVKEILNKFGKFPIETRVQYISKEPILGSLLDIIYLIIPIVSSEYNIPNLEVKTCHTISRHYPGKSLGWHYDKKLCDSDIAKAVCYLGPSTSGTEFDIGDGNFYKPIIKVGDIVVFDIKLRHRGSELLDNTKHLVGARLGNKLNY